MTLLGDHPLNPILPAQDGDRARAHYRDVLGLELLSGPDEDPMMFRAGNGSLVVLSEMPDRTPPPYPVVSFLVTGIEQLTDELAARGVEFRPLGTGSFAGVEGRHRGRVMDFGAVKSSWFHDSEGNVLALNEIVTA